MASDTVGTNGNENGRGHAGSVLLLDEDGSGYADGLVLLHLDGGGYGFGKLLLMLFWQNAHARRHTRRWHLSFHVELVVEKYNIWLGQRRTDIDDSRGLIESAFRNGRVDVRWW